MENKQYFLSEIEKLQDIGYGDVKLGRKFSLISKEDACKFLLENGFDPFKYAKENGINIPNNSKITFEFLDDPDCIKDIDVEQPIITGNEVQLKILEQYEQNMEQKRKRIRDSGFNNDVSYRDANLNIPNDSYEELLRTRQEKLAKLKAQGFSYTIKSSCISDKGE
jgi:hypothetical protein